MTSSTRWSPICRRTSPATSWGGYPSNIIEGVARGVDFFDCVMPARNARHAKLFTWSGALNIRNEKYKLDERPIDPDCDCPVCRSFSAYLRHLFAAEEMLAMRLAVLHNLYFYNKLAERIRQAWTRANSRHSGRSIPRNWPGGCEVSVNEAKRACQNLLFAL